MRRGGWADKLEPPVLYSARSTTAARDSTASIRETPARRDDDPLRRPGKNLVLCQKR